MKIVLSIILMFFITKVFSESTEEKGFICTFGEKENIYENCFSYEEKYVSKYLFLEKDTYKIIEKKNYINTKKFINITLFIGNKA